MPISLPLKDYIPKSWICFREGYTKTQFLHDLTSGISVGIIALPLALAFAMASGVAPEKGLFTAIIAGFLISLLGGSRVQIGGPTGAFVIVIYTVMQKHGYEGLAVATLLAGGLTVLMGLARFGSLLKFIPFPVITGFTAGIALVILSAQVKDFFGLEIDQLGPGFIERWWTYFTHIHTAHLWPLVVGSGTLGVIIVLRRYFPRVPGGVAAIALATIVAFLFQLPVETIESKFGALPQSLPKPALPFLSFDLIIRVIPDAITIALLGSIEALLSAAVADGMTGFRHKSNGELVGQGIANIASVLFGGIPATGAIARTAANVKMGGRTPVAGMAHALTLFILMVCFAPLAVKIPLASLSAIMVFVAWNMSELPHFIETLKGERSDALVLLVTFFLTLFVDLTVAVQVGVIVAAFLFLKRMTDNTTVAIDEPEKELKAPSDICLISIDGPFFYSVAHLLYAVWQRRDRMPRVCIIRLTRVPLVDATGIKAFHDFEATCKQKGVVLLFAGVTKKVHRQLQSAFPPHNLFDTMEEALAHAERVKQDSPMIQPVLEHSS